LYISFILLFSVFAWYKKHVAFSSLSLGIAIALHPASAVLLPILIYEWWQHKKYIKNALIIIAGLLISWLPIILFEIMTKGFLIRQFLILRTDTVELAFSLQPLLLFQTLSDLPIFLFLILSGLTYHYSESRAKVWLLLTIGGIAITCFFSGLHEY